MLSAQVQRIDDDLATLKTEHAQHTTQVLTSVNAFRTAATARFDRVDAALDGIRADITQHTERLDGIESKLDSFISEQRTANTALLEAIAGLAARKTD